MCKAMDDLAEKRAEMKVCEIIGNMLNMGMTVEQISKAVNIPIEKILELQAEPVPAR